MKDYTKEIRSIYYDSGMNPVAEINEFVNDAVEEELMKQRCFWLIIIFAICSVSLAIIFKDAVVERKSTSKTTEFNQSNQ